MSGNNTFETSDLADPHFSVEAAKVLCSLPQCSYGKNYFLVFSRLLTGGKSKRKYPREETFGTYKLIFKNIACIYEASLYKQQYELLKTKRNSLKSTCKVVNI